MSNLIDARGKSCPIPVLMAKKEVDSGSGTFSMIVDNPAAVENLKRLAKSRGYESTVNTQESDFEITFVKSEDFCVPMHFQDQDPWAVLVGKIGLGEGDAELGITLMNMFFFTLTQDDHVPAYVLFMNSGVKLPVENEQVVEHLKVLSEKGTEILICGTCLNHYQIADQIQVGTISNMYDLVDAMKAVNIENIKDPLSGTFYQGIFIILILIHVDTVFAAFFHCANHLRYRDVILQGRKKLTSFFFRSSDQQSARGLRIE